MMVNNSSSATSPSIASVMVVHNSCGTPFGLVRIFIGGTSGVLLHRSDRLLLPMTLLFRRFWRLLVLILQPTVPMVMMDHGSSTATVTSIISSMMMVNNSSSAASPSISIASVMVVNNSRAAPLGVVRIFIAGIGGTLP